MFGWGRAWRCVLLVCIVVSSALGTRPAHASPSPRLPAEDPFYRYTGRRPLGAIAPGTVLKQRSVRVALGAGNATPVRADQLLYRTTGQLGQPTVTVTTVLRPLRVRVLPRIIEYLSFYDGLGSQCDPSYTLAGGDPGDATYAHEAEEEELLIAYYVAQGDIVTVPDFEGTHLAWMAGRESGYGALDAIRATEKQLRLRPTTKVGLSGYSGGSVAADWASELAPQYAPRLNIVGVAEAGIPANYLNHIAYMDGTAEYSAAIPGELLGLSRAYRIDLSKYLSALGKQIVQQESGVCIASAFGKYQVTVHDLMQPAYRDLAQAAPFSTMLRDQQMGTTRTRPRGPLLMAIGNADGKGDGAMTAADARALARHYCRQGIRVDYQEYAGASHQVAAAFFEPQTGPFLQARFAGLPFVSNCARLG
jgi:secretory lipase